MTDTLFLADGLLTQEGSASTGADLTLETQLGQASAAAAPVADPNAGISADQRQSLLAAVTSARDLPPGVRERLAKLVEQASTLDSTGEPLLARRGVLELLAQGLPAVLRRETPASISRLEHPAGDAFFALSGDELSDQQAEQIAREQLQRAGLLRADH